MNPKKIIIFIPFLFIGLLVGGFFFIKAKFQKQPEQLQTEEVYFVETTLEQRPLIKLTPESDGHWLNLFISAIADAESIEYELTYRTGEGINQGAVGGPTKLNGQSTYEKKILLGTESSGHYNYHDGVESGTVSVRLNGGPGPRRFISQFSLQKGTVDELVFPDEALTLSGDFTANNFYVVLETAGLVAPLVEDSQLLAGPYGLFSSQAKDFSSIITTADSGVVYYQTAKGNWEEILSGNEVNNPGYFVILAKDLVDK